MLIKPEFYGVMIPYFYTKIYSYKTAAFIIMQQFCVFVCNTYTMISKTRFNSLLMKTNLFFIQFIIIFLPLFISTNNIYSQSSCTAPYNSSPEINWGIVKHFQSNAVIWNGGTPTAADLNGDGISEILAPASDYTGYYVYAGNGTNATTASKDFVIAISNARSVQPAIANIITATSTPEVVMVNATGYLYIFNNIGGSELNYLFKSTTASQYTNTVTPYIVDIDEDGTPEIVLGNDIFGIVNGALVKRVAGPALGYVGVSTVSTGCTIDVVVTDIIATNPGKEIVFGSRVYGVNLSSGITTILKDLNTVTGSGIPANDNGPTAVADMNGDGKLDIIYNGSTHVVMWNPNSTTLANTLLFKRVPPSFNYGARGLPLIANVYNDKTTGGKLIDLPEALIINSVSGSAGIVTAYNLNYNTTSGTTTQYIWSLATNDMSGCTGITAFDFDGNGIREIIYRDQSTLRIINGNLGTPVNYTSAAVTSATWGEYPIVADLNNDGQAEIAVTGNNSLQVFGSDPLKFSWRGAPNYWNQRNYRIVNINNDLTVPATETNSAIAIAFNNNLAQLQFSDAVGNGILNGSTFAADASITINSITGVCPDLTISATISNNGSYQLPAGTYVTLYDANPTSGTANVVGTYQTTTAIAIGASSNVTMTAKLIGAGSIIYAVVNDKGTTARPFNLSSWVSNTLVNECSYTNNFDSKTFTPCLDLDGDAVPDFADIDDDNDGVLDSLEGNSCVVFINDRQIFNDPVVKQFNLIANGGFELGNTGFTSTYNNRGSLGACADYLVSPSGWASSIGSLSEGNALQLNADCEPPFTAFWSQTVTVKPNTNYKFGFSIRQGNYAVVSYKINGGSLQGNYGTTGSWVSKQNIVNSGNSTSMSISLFETTGAPSSADFAVDDIFLIEVKDVYCAQNLDTDLDSIPNHLDLDSDGDGCYDAVEAGVLTSSTTGIVAGTYGANGFANSKETASESGIFNSNYSYSLALSNSVNACLDSDGDGVVDIFDLDDDNDGVLDVVEQTCITNNTSTDYYGPNYWSSITWTGAAYTATYPTATPDIYIDGNLTNGIEVFRPGTRANPIVGDDFTATPIIFTLNAVLPLHADGFSLVNEYGTLGDGISKLDIQLFSGPSNNRVLIGTEVFNNIMSKTTTAQYAFTRGYDNISSIKIKVYKKDPAAGEQAENGMQIGELGLYSNAGTYCFDIDTDNDGTINSLDLDSDGDGCFDAIEAGVLSTTSTGKVTGSYGANGFADSKETVTDNGNYNGNYNYSFAIYNKANTCLDSDADGVLDMLDLDDDNDGILDVNEQKTCTDAPTYTFKNIDGSNTGALAYNAAFPSWMKHSYTESEGGFKFIFDSPVTDIAFEFASIYQDDRVGDFSVKLTDGTILNGIDFELLTSYAPTAAIWTPQPNNVNNFTGNFSKLNGAPFKTGTPYFKTTNLTSGTGQSWGIVHLKNIAGANTVGISEVSFKIIGGTSTSGTGGLAIYTTCLSYLDSDNDGITNSLDLDSDGDGCPDAKEVNIQSSLSSGAIKNGTVGSVTTTTVANAIAGTTGNYGANGFADVLETTSESGNYNGTYNYSFVINSNVNACLDFDSDGVADSFDLDDDNDGVLDEDEMTKCNSSVLITPTAATSSPVYGGCIADRTIDGSGFTGSGLAALATAPATLNDAWLLKEPLTEGFIDYTLPANSNIGGVVLWAPDAYNYGGGDAPPKDFTVQITYNNGQVFTTGIFTTAQPNGNGDNPGAQIFYFPKTFNKATKVKLNFLNGWYDINNNSLSQVSTVGQTVSAAYNMFLGEVRVLCGSGDIDTDNDGMPNRLDLDSDGDGCSDAVEAGTTIISTSGIASLAKLTATVIPAPYGANGFADGLETSVGSGNYNGNYTYNRAIQSLVKACTDSDGDNVADVLDLDDDNDGILDCEEGSYVPLNFSAPTIFTNRNLDSLGYVKYSTTQPVVGGQMNPPSGDANGNISVSVNAGVGIRTSYSLAFTDPIDLIIRNNTKIIQGYLTYDEYFEFSTSAGTVIGLSDPAYELQVFINNAWVDVPANYEAATIKWKPKEAFQPGAGSFAFTIQNATSFTFYHYNNTNSTANATTLNISRYCVDIDTDNDGIPNRLDLDSDGDGCTDALEAGVSATLNTGDIKNGLYGVVKSTTSKSNAVAASPYGLNGLADGVETNSESGFVNYVSKYNPYALSVNLASCRDTDGDGVSDLIDIDDDNDGVLDAEESPTCFMTATDWNTSDKTLFAKITSELNTLAGFNNFAELTDNNVDLSGTKFITTPAQSLLGKTIFKIELISPTQLDAIYIRKNDAVQIFATTANSLKIQGSNDNSTWIDLTAAITPPADASNKTINGAITLLNSNKFILTANPGKYKYYRFFGVGTTAANILSGVANEFFFDVNNTTYQASFYPISNCTNDSDGDGILNHQDLDTDNDGCSDAIEANSSLTATSINVYPTGIDANNNGLLNDYESTTAGAVNYTSSYEPYAISANLAACKDTDGDGVADNTDLDDDNDGILDAVESPNCFYTANDWHFGNRSSIIVTSPLSMTSPQNNPQKLVDGKNSGVSYDVRMESTTTLINALGTGKEVYKFNMQIPVKLSKVYLGYTGVYSHFNDGTKLILRGSNDGTNWTNLSGTSGTPAVTYDATINTNSATETATISPYPATTQYATSANIFSVTQNAAKYQYYDIFWSSGGGINNTGYANEIYFDVATDYIPSAHPKFNCNTDTDGDGILNHQDLDSDGDGCPDAKEEGITANLTAAPITNLAGATIASGTTTTTIQNAIVAGTGTSTFGNNGFANSLETASESAIYNGTYNYTIANNKYLSSCLDSDGDGVSDVLDLDDDNDGVLDIVECSSPGFQPLLPRFDIASGASKTVSVTGFPEELWIDVWTLDNNFNLKVNNVDITNVSELNFAPMGAANPYPKPYTDIVRADGTAIYPSGNVWNYPSTAQYPLIRVKISRGGYAKIYGYDFVNGTGNYQELILVNAVYQKVPISLTGNNTIFFSQDNTWAPSYLNAEFNTFNSAGFCDNDGDGIENRLDLDSDNDNCSDAYESKTTTDATANFQHPANANYGTNGFLNTLETVNDNGIYKSIYPYDYAIDSIIKSCLDFDGDGVPDISDLDDDNDGVLDAVESPNCFYTLAELAKPIAVSSELTPYDASGTYAVEKSIDGLIATYLAFKSGQYLANKEILKYTANGLIDITSLTLDLDFRAISTDAASTFRFQGSADNVLWDNLNTTAVASLTYTPPATLVLTNNLQAGKKYKYFRLYGVAGTSNFGGVANATFNLAATNQPSANPKLICANDTDSDGIPNHLDLDSDGDACPDAKEAGITGTLTTGTVVNLTSPTGTATTATTGVANAIATGSYGANGFADALETSTESGNYSGVYNYDYAVSDFLNACADNDNDGVPDLIDIDDDNDGILDAVESPKCFYNRVELAVPVDISTELLPYSNYFIEKALDGNITTASAFAPSQNWVGKVIFKYTAISQIPIASIDIDLVNWGLSSDANQKFKLQGSTDNNNWSDLSAAIYSLANTGTFSIPNTLLPNAKFKYYRVIGVAGTSYYGGVLESRFVLSNAFVQSQYTKANCLSDTDDIDLIPNHLDLDSDGDGCSDALEAGTTSNTSVNYKFTGSASDFGVNGFYNTLEKTNPESNLYKAVYVYEYATDSTYKGCTDTDGDGVTDLIDIDDDNDGILDAIESPSCFYTLDELISPAKISSELTQYSSYVIGNAIDGVGTTLSAFAPNQDWVGKEIFKFTAKSYIAIAGMSFDLINWSLSSASSSTFKLQGSGDNLVWTDLSSSTYSTATSGTFTISNTLAATSKFKYFRIIGVAGSCSYSGVYEARFNLSTSTSASANPKPNCLTGQSDGDIIPNHLDLDSDGDGCSDALEAGTSTSKSANFKFTGSALDFGANGFYNTLEKTNAESNLYLGVYTYYYATDNESNACEDSDNDGINDVIDLDDDNDGVLDFIEQNCTGTSMSKSDITVSSGINWYFQNAPAIGLNALLDGTLIQQLYPTETSISNKTVFRFNFTTPKVLNLIELANVANQTPFIAGGTYKIQGSNDEGTTWSDIVSSQTVANTSPILATTNSIKFEMPSNYKPFLSYRIYAISMTGQANWSTEIYFREVTCVDINTDGDGLANRLDLDSDGDNCFDAVESGATLLSTSGVTGAAKLTTSVIPSTPNYGANGFANGLETSSESGAFAGTYTYSFATDANTSGCLDTDGDFVPNVVDLDDDNDGVLDTNEQTNCITSGIDLTTLTFNGSAITAKTANSLTTAGGDNWQTSYSNQNLKLPISLKFKHNSTTGYEMFGLHSITKAQTPTSWGDEGYKFYPQITNVYGYFTTAWDFGAIAILPTDELSIDISATGYVTAAINGVTQKAFQGIVSDYKLVLSSYRTSSLTDIILTDGTRPAILTCTDLDTDLDGVPNRLDLDSDGDNCFDAVESGTTYITTSGVASNAKTTTRVIPAPYGANGLANGLETTTESGIYNGVYTYTFATDAAVSACLDTDTDGVPDLLDLDDDNDGVLDLVECPASTNNILVNGTFDVNKTGWTGSANWAYYAPGFLWNSAENVTNDLLSQTFAKPVVNAEASTVDIIFDFNTNGVSYSISSTTTASMDVILNNKIYATINNPSGGTTASVVGKNGATVNVSSVNIAANNVPTTKIIVKVPKTALSNSNTLSFAFTATSDDFGIDNVFIGTQVSACDTDGDGIVNSKDLDSDGDGCSDAVEAGTTYISTSGVATSAKLTTVIIPAPYGANGFADGLEANTETGIYKSTYSYDLAINANTKACIDTDNDGVADVTDLDDDNDGVLDEEECPISSKPYSLYTYNYPTTVNATNVPVNIEGKTTLNVLLDQQTNGTAPNAFSYNSVTNWKLVASNIQPASNKSITVKITPTASTTATYVFADAMLLTNGTNTYVIDNNTDGFSSTGTWSQQGGGYANTNSYLTYPSYVGNTATWTFSNLFVSPQINCDNDGDGIPNRLDLDSDGDGCADAIEAGSSTTATGIFVCPTGVDANTNGLLDNYEGTPAGTTNYTSTYANYALINTKNYCTDTDGDGIKDLIDIDDDNDGILDSEECPTAQVNTNENNGTFGTATAPRNLTNTAVMGGYVYSGSNTGAAQYAVVNSATQYHPSSTFWRYPGHTTGATNDAYLAVNGSTTVGYFYNESISLRAAVPYRISYWHQAASAANDYSLAAEIIAANGNVLATASTGPQNSLGWKLATIDFTLTTNQTVNFKIKNVSVNASGNDFSIDDISLVPLGCPDTDADGIPNSLDLDSDGDGCADAVEAGSSNTATSTINYPTGLDANANGLLNTYEGSPAGTINYTTTYSNYALDNTKNKCLLNNNYTLTAPTAICATSSSPGVLFSSTNVVLQSGTAGSVSFKWQRSKNGTEWVDIVAGLGQTDSGVTYTNFSSTNTLSYLTLSAAPNSINGYRYRIVSTNASGYAANSNAVSLSINIAPTISIQPANSLKCTTDATTFTISALGGTSVLTYQWQVSTSANVWTNITAGNIPNHTGITYSGFTTAALSLSAVPVSSNNFQYRCIVSNACGNITSAAAILNPSPLAPSISVGGSLNICEGSSLTLSTTPINNVTYQWYKDVLPIGGATAASYLATQSGVYSLIATLNAGCSISNSNSSASTTVVVVPIPTASITQGASVSLTGGSIVLTANTNTNTPSYTWYSKATNSANWSVIAGQSASTLTVNAVGDYKVLISNGTCSIYSGITTVLQLPSASANGVTTFCAPGSVVLTTTLAAGASSLRWLNNGEPIIPLQNALNYTASQTGSYAAQFLDANNLPIGGSSNVVVGTNATAAIAVTVNPLPTPSFIATANTVCAGESITLAGTGGPNYQWQLNGVDIAGANNLNYTPLQTGNYKLKIVDANTCQAISSATVITINPLPSIPNISNTTASFCSPGSVDLTNFEPATISGITYEWHTVAVNPSNLNLVSNKTNITSIGNYYLFAKSSSGCFSFASNALQVVNNSLSVANISTSNKTYNLNATAVELAASVTNPTYVLRWYDAQTAGNLLAGNIIPSTASVGVTNYYVEQYDPNGTGCISPNRQLVTINVVALASAVGENGTVPANGGVAINNIAANDIINGTPATLGTTGNATVATSGTWPVGITLNTSTGAISVAAGTAPGIYPVTYELCDKLTPQTCATVTDTILISPIININSENGNVSVAGGEVISNIAANDQVNGVAATLGTAGNATVAQSGTWPAGISLNDSSGAISVAAGTAPGTYPVTYQLCDKLTPITCATITDTIVVAATSSAVGENGTAPATGGVAINNIAANDIINGTPATLGTAGNATVATSGTWPVGITLNTTTGAISVAAGTAPGTYPVTYQLCDKLTPQTCATITDTIIVTPSINPITDYRTAPETGGIAINNIAANDQVNGVAATLGTAGNAMVATSGTWPVGITLNTTTGAISVAAGTVPGTYPVTYQLCDKLIPQTCATITDTIVVYPVTNTLTPITREDSTINICVPQLSNMGAGATISSCGAPLHGTFNISNFSTTGCISYTPSANYVGKDTACIVVCNNGVCDTTKFIITVNPKTDLLTPISREDSTINICVPQLSNMGAGATISSCGAPLHGTMNTSNFSTTGCISYTSNTNYVGKDTACIVICNNGVCDTTKFIISVKPKTDLLTPITREDSTISICVPQLSSMGAGATISSCGAPLHGTFNTSNFTTTGCISYTPNTNYVGKDTACIVICNNGVCDTTRFIITVFEKLRVNLISKTNIACYGIPTGAIEIKVSGGDKPYQIIWNTIPPKSTTAINNLTAGTYIAYIKDSLGRKDTITVEITQPAMALTVSATTINAKCYNDINGSIALNVVGGTMPYTYLWNTSATTATISNLKAGNYSVEITDALGCTLNRNYVVTEPQILQISLVKLKDVVCRLDSNGAIEVSIDGGTPPYNYTWSNGANTKNINKLTFGSYQLSVTDNNGCNAEANYTVTVERENCDAPVFIPQGFSPDGDGTNESFVIPGIENYPNNTLKIYNRWGSIVYEKSPYNNDWNGQPGSGLIVLNSDGYLPTGTYFYVIELSPGLAPITGYIYLDK